MLLTIKLKILLVISYFIGSIPFGLLVAFFVRRIDIRQYGSGNIGATNVLRVVGKAWGILVFILDFLKGFIVPVLIWVVAPDVDSRIYLFSIGLVVAGHTWPVFLKFKGGKGVATSLGALAGLSIVYIKLALALVIALASWIIVFLAKRYVSLASILAALIFMLVALSLTLPLDIKLLTAVLFIVIVMRHWPNIQRLLVGKENRF